METTQLIITIISAVIGSGGIAAAITAIVSSKKYKAEAMLLEQQAETARKDSEERMHENIRKQIMELSDVHKKESAELRKQNAILSTKINELNDEIQKLMEWIVYDNAKYRAWLETELVKLKPDIEFPECRPAPKFVTEPTPDDSDNN